MRPPSRGRRVPGPKRERVSAETQLGAPAHADAYALAKIVLSGEAALESGGTFEPNSSFVSLNQAGDVVFSAGISSGSVGAAV